MLSLLRLIFFLGLVGGAGYGVLFILAEVMEPPTEEFVVPIPKQQFQNR